MLYGRARWACVNDAFAGLAGQVIQGAIYSAISHLLHLRRHNSRMSWLVAGPFLNGLDAEPTPADVRSHYACPRWSISRAAWYGQSLAHSGRAGDLLGGPGTADDIST